MGAHGADATLAKTVLLVRLLHESSEWISNSKTNGKGSPRERAVTADSDGERGQTVTEAGLNGSLETPSSTLVKSMPLIESF